MRRALLGGPLLPPAQPARPLPARLLRPLRGLRVGPRRHPRVQVGAPRRLAAAARTNRPSGSPRTKAAARRGFRRRSGSSGEAARALVPRAGKTRRRPPRPNRRNPPRRTRGSASWGRARTTGRRRLPKRPQNPPLPPLSSPTRLPPPRCKAPTLLLRLPTPRCSERTSPPRRQRRTRGRRTRRGTTRARGLPGVRRQEIGRAHPTREQCTRSLPASGLPKPGRS